ncbi:DUF3131 domain-containing protein [Pseudodesulfovibrio sp. JC047]|uniref:DUF3131 domain-containing protein n=1 Tax=Pseudodesulfovibrio sp. JC047 TaxID=2683199 RepID=UPI0013D254B3|nr:DUF3131 domain-containing protein [Pseudodesulfovibrio sp. JC047]NDV19257.1 DUF3131 domain-containing protein [Pseudodesulfovibrio sp. JC047]
MWFKRALPLLLVILVICAAPASANENKSIVSLATNKRFAEAVSLYKNRDYNPSSIILEDIAENMRGLSTTMRGVIYVMASKAAEQGRNARAYEFWGMATAKFARAGTTWKTVKKELGQKLQLANLGASTPVAAGIGEISSGVSLPPEAGRIQTAWNLFELSDYSRPVAGLKVNDSTAQIWDSVEQHNEQAMVIPYSEGGLAGVGATPSTAPRQNAYGQPPAVPMGRAVPMNAPAQAKASQMASQRMPGNVRGAADLAWAYFQRNHQPSTGLFNGLDLYPVATVWEIGSSIAALVSAEGLSIITKNDFHRRMRLLLQTLASMDLYNNELPNKLYFTDTARMVGEDQMPSTKGLGWSAIDVGRLLLWLKITEKLHPALEPATQAVFKRFRTERLVFDGMLTGVNLWAGKENATTEGFFGYGPYAAQALQLWELNAWASRDYRPHIQEKTIFGISVPYDTRPGATLSSKPFALIQMEFGRSDQDEDRLARAIYEVQSRRFEQTKIATASGDGRIDRSPWFATSAIIAASGNAEWQCLSPFSNQPLDLYWASTGIAFAWDALYNTAYTRKLVDIFMPLAIKGKGFQAGKYDSGGTNTAVTLDTNALILEAALYRHLGGAILTGGKKGK